MSKANPYLEGFNAWHNGQRKTANPYGYTQDDDELTVDGYSWLAGFNAAECDYEPKSTDYLNPQSLTSNFDD